MIGQKLFFFWFIFVFQISFTSEFHRFVLIVSSNNKHLDTIFKQEYPFFRVVSINAEYNDEEFSKVEVLSDKLTNVTPTRRFGKVGALWLIIHKAHDDEIIIDLSDDKFFLEANALALFNEQYQQKDVWMTSGDCSSVSFYAWLFKNIKLETLTEHNNFRAETDCLYIYPLFKMAQNHCGILKEPLIGYDGLERNMPEVIDLQEEYESLNERPATFCESDSADLIVFSYNRPMQIYAFLESLERYVTGLKTINVIYKVDNNEWEKVYEQVIMRFPTVNFFKQKISPKGVKRDNSFKEKTLNVSFESPSDYIVYAVDDIVITDYIDLSECIYYLKKTGAYGFYLRLGNNINYSYLADCSQAQPNLLPLDDKVYAWRFGCNSGGWDWGCPASIDMTLHEKKLIKEHIESLYFEQPNIFEGAWSNSSGSLMTKFGLCYRTSKMVNLPLNKVQLGLGKNMGITSLDLFFKFKDGLKIDIGPLFKIRNNSTHFEYVPYLVKR